MLQQALKTHRFAFSREDVITTPFRREPVDIDDTVPVALYTQPYERIELQSESGPYELIEIEPEIDVEAFSAAPVAAPAPNTTLRVAMTLSLLICALVAGFELALLLL